MAIYNVHGGHNPAGRVACGAVGLLDESKEDRLITFELINYLRKMEQQQGIALVAMEQVREMFLRKLSLSVIRCQLPMIFQSILILEEMIITVMGFKAVLKFMYVVPIKARRKSQIAPSLT